MNKTNILIGLLLLTPLVASAADTPVLELKIKDHQFEPAQLEVPADTKVKLIVHNHDATPEEFESYDLNREKIVSGNGKITLFIGPLQPGTYKFFGEFHEDTAQGSIVVR
ncbi:MAG: cupredoxin domain-containing protein [Bdellovibrionales bacterium]|nr:cupredoxin domain-containing protein [Bdellovibrionales bacterium]